MEHLKLLFFTLFFLFPILILAENSPAPPETPQEEEFLPDAISYNKTLKNRYSFFLHKRNYVMPITHNWKTHNEVYSAFTNNTGRTGEYYTPNEAEFQVSFFVPLYKSFFNTNWDLLFAYTHHTYWQVYNAAWSKPFRETNYNPELFFRRSITNDFVKKFFQATAFDIGYMHESNGQIQILSRSWDRVFARLQLLNRDLAITITGWWRIPEKKSEDDNPSIYRYYGYGEVSIQKSIESHTIDLKIPFSEKPGVEINYSYPWIDYWRFFINYRTGYAHSLIEYDKPINRIGIGLTLEANVDKR